MVNDKLFDCGFINRYNFLVFIEIVSIIFKNLLVKVVIFKFLYELLIVVMIFKICY